MDSHELNTRTKWSCVAAIVMIGAGIVLAYTGYSDAGKWVAGIGIGFAGGVFIGSEYFERRSRGKQ